MHALAVQDLKQQVGFAMLQMFLTYAELEKKAHTYGTGTVIYPSEIHLLSVIANHPGIHVSGLAQTFGYTRGTVSETLRKLEKKSLIRKETDPKNLSRLCVFATDQGRIAHERHQTYHRYIDGMIAEFLRDAPEEHIRSLLRFFQRVDERLRAFADNFDEVFQGKSI